MKETGESGSTKNKTVILLLSILLTLLWFVGEILVSYHWMKVNLYPVQVRNLRYADTVTDAGFKMVVISDLHDHEFGKDNEKLIRCVKEQDPEMIILDGDMLNEDSKSDEVPVRLVKGLAEIAPVYYALGNHELDYIGTAEGKKMDGTRMDGRSAEAQRSVTISPIRSEQSLCCHRRRRTVSAV